MIETMIIIIIVIIVILLYVLRSANDEEHMVNIAPLSKEVSWTTDETCNYQMTQVYLDVLNEYGIKKDNKDWSLYFPCSYNNATTEIEKVKPQNPDQRIFIVTNTDEISSKSDLWKNLVATYGRNYALTISPQTYILYDNDDLDLFKKEYDSNKIYIMKKNIQRQEGIKITKNKDEILKGYNEGYVVVQELLSDPYLIRGRKTNMRFYLLLVCQNNEVAAFVHNDGFMYYTKMPFTKDTTDFGPNITTGYIERWIYKVNPLTHADFRKYLDNTGRELLPSEQRLIDQGQQISQYTFNRIYDMLRQVVNSIKHKVCNGSHLQNNITFQLFGADVAVDELMNAKIIEVNIGPNLNTHDGRDSEIKHTVVRDIFKTLKMIPDTKNDNGFIQII